MGLTQNNTFGNKGRAALEKNMTTGSKPEFAIVTAGRSAKNSLMLYESIMQCYAGTLNFLQKLCSRLLIP